MAIYVSGVTPRYNDGSADLAYADDSPHAAIVDGVCRCFDEVDDTVRDRILRGLSVGIPFSVSLYCRSNRSGCTRGYNLVSFTFSPGSPVRLTAGYFHGYGSRMEATPVTRVVANYEQMRAFVSEYGRARSSAVERIESLCGYVPTEV